MLESVNTPNPETLTQDNLDTLSFSLCGLVSALVTEDGTRKRMTERAVSATGGEAVQILDDLGLVAVRRDWIKANDRGRKIIERAYPSSPTNTYSDEYVERMLRVLPVLFLGKEHYKSSKPTTHIALYNRWLDGYSTKVIAAAEGYHQNYPRMWAHRHFPAALNKKVDFFEIAKTADLLYDVEDELTS